MLTTAIDPAKVAPNCVWLFMKNTSQSCNAGTRLLVPAKLHDQVVDIAVKATAGYKTGNPLEDDTDIGPLANKGQFEKVKAILEEAETGEVEDAKIVVTDVMEAYRIPTEEKC